MTFQVTIKFGQSFMSFLARHFEFCWAIFIDWSFNYVFLKAILNWNFRLLDSDFFIGLMLHHCLRRWPNIKTTLRRHFVFYGITTASSMLLCSI